MIMAKRALFFIMLLFASEVSLALTPFGSEVCCLRDGVYMGVTMGYDMYRVSDNVGAVVGVYCIFSRFETKRQRNAWWLFFRLRRVF